ncbi:hypothetical protein JOB18_035528 [Solea senegalensis]|uniref:Uncharacterized protein n=1 Tax=Solea senegalensis TaxID=28829 RepID=A0AAV6QF21_SOLSE|nr:hypothetical protein JOB18_035528 [Solea senegalensis]
MDKVSLSNFLCGRLTDVAPATTATATASQANVHQNCGLTKWPSLGIQCLMEKSEDI